MLKVKVDMGNIEEKVSESLNQGQFALDQQVLKDSNYFIPKDQGYLEESGILHSKIGEGEIIWRTPYARRLYYNPQYNFSTDKNPNARGMWFEHAKSLKLKSWLDVAKNEVKNRLR